MFEERSRRDPAGCLTRQRAACSGKPAGREPDRASSSSGAGVRPSACAIPADAAALDVAPTLAKPAAHVELANRAEGRRARRCALALALSDAVRSAVCFRRRARRARKRTPPANSIRGRRESHGNASSAERNSRSSIDLNPNDVSVSTIACASLGRHDDRARRSERARRSGILVLLLPGPGRAAVRDSRSDARVRRRLRRRSPSLAVAYYVLSPFELMPGDRVLGPIGLGRRPRRRRNAALSRDAQPRSSGRRARATGRGRAMRSTPIQRVTRWTEEQVTSRLRGAVRRLVRHRSLQHLSGPFSSQFGLSDSLSMLGGARACGCWSRHSRGMRRGLAILVDCTRVRVAPTTSRRASSPLPPWPRRRTSYCHAQRRAADTLRPARSGDGDAIVEARRPAGSRSRGRVVARLKPGIDVRLR